MRSWGNAPADHNGHIVHFRGDILGQIIECDTVDDGRAVTWMQHRLPLDEAGRWRVHRKLFFEIDSLPLAPVAVGIVNIAAARKKIKVAATAHFDASPLGEILRIKDVALKGALGHWVRAEQKNLPQIACSGVDPAF